MKEFIFKNFGYVIGIFLIPFVFPIVDKIFNRTFKRENDNNNRPTYNDKNRQAKHTINRDNIKNKKH